MGKPGHQLNKRLLAQVISMVLIMISTGFMLYGSYERMENAGKHMDAMKQVYATLSDFDAQYSYNAETPALAELPEQALNLYNKSKRSFRHFSFISGLMWLGGICAIVQIILSQPLWVPISEKSSREAAMLS